MPFLVNLLDLVLSERVHARAITVLKLAVLIFGSVNFVTAAILIAMDGACVVSLVAVQQG